MKGFVLALVALLREWGAWGVFLFAIVDGAGLPTPGGLDASFLTVVALRPNDAYWLAAVTLLGTTIGNLIWFLMWRRGGEAALLKYRERPRFRRFEAWFQHYGLVTVFIPALIPIIPLPLKFFVICAAVFEVSIGTFLLVFLAARIPRYLALAYLGYKLGNESMPWLKAHAWHLGGVALGLFVFAYLLILIIDWRHRRAIAKV